MATRTRKTSEEKVLRGLQITGIVRFFSKDKAIEVKGKKVEITECWTNVSSKNKDGEYDQKGITLLFGKEDEYPDHNTDIKIIEGFMTLSGKGAYQRPAIFVKEWDYVEVKK